MFEIFKTKADIEPILYIKEECIDEFLKGIIKPNAERLDTIWVSKIIDFTRMANVSAHNLPKDIIYTRNLLKGVNEVHFELNDNSVKGEVTIKTVKKYKVEKNDSISVKLVQYEVTTEVINIDTEK